MELRPGLVRNTRHRRVGRRRRPGSAAITALRPSSSSASTGAASSPLRQADHAGRSRRALGPGPGPWSPMRATASPPGGLGGRVQGRICTFVHFGGCQPPKCTKNDLRRPPYHPGYPCASRHGHARCGSTAPPHQQERAPTIIGTETASWPPPSGGRASRPCSTRRGTRRWLRSERSYFLVSQKIRSISEIWARRSSATATSLVFLASPAAFVAFQNRSWSCG
jgi:hypothetical protein